MIALTIGLAVLVGISLGLLGGGGSILTVPLLAYVAGLEPTHAIAMSLLVVGVTSAIAAITHARAGRVSWRVAVLFGLVAMAGAYAGGRLARCIPGTVLLVSFAVIMIAAGVAMLRGRNDTTSADRDQPLPVLRIALLGVAVGMISGLVGAGGGFLLVPALALLGGLPMPTAVGTSLVVIAMQSFAGFAGHLTNEQIDWHLAAFITGRRRGRRPDRRPTHRVRQPGHPAPNVRVVRPADGLGDPGPRGQPGSRRRRRGPDAGCRGHVLRLHQIRTLPTAPAHPATANLRRLGLTSIRDGAYTPLGTVLQLANERRDT